MDVLNWMGLAAFLLTISSLFLLRKKNSIGWLVFIPSYIIQIIIFAIQKNWFLMAQMIVLAVFSLVNYVEWEDMF